MLTHLPEAVLHFVLSGDEKRQQIGCRHGMQNHRQAPENQGGNRYVYFTQEMESLLREHYKNCVYETATYNHRKLTEHVIHPVGYFAG